MTHINVSKFVAFRTMLIFMKNNNEEELIKRPCIFQRFSAKKKIVIQKNKIFNNFFSLRNVLLTK